jgi:heme/copper-type cytochrome/quinol oxidase subunit 2
LQRATKDATIAFSLSVPLVPGEGFSWLVLVMVVMVVVAEVVVVVLVVTMLLFARSENKFVYHSTRSRRGRQP